MLRGTMRLTLGRGICGRSHLGNRAILRANTWIQANFESDVLAEVWCYEGES
jgi:hypothetical protein